MLEAARNAAAEIRAKAQVEADERLGSANADADQMVGQARAEADAVLEAANRVLGERSAEAEAAAANIIGAATPTPSGCGARRSANTTRPGSTRSTEVDAARQDGRRMIAEARAVRERILTDMARRRNVSRQQVERLRAARERLLESVDGVRRSVDQVTARTERRAGRRQARR